MYDSDNYEQNQAYRCLMEVVLLFELETEKETFEEYVEYSIGLIKKDVADCSRYSYISTGDRRKNDTYLKNLRVGYVLNQYLSEWRKYQKSSYNI